MYKRARHYADLVYFKSIILGISRLGSMRDRNVVFGDSSYHGNGMKSYCGEPSRVILMHARDSNMKTKHHVHVVYRQVSAHVW